MSFGYVEKGFSPSTEDLKKINKYTRREFDADSLYVFTVILCDNDIDRDFEKFSLSALNELKTLFVGKTGISDHSMKSSDQKARVFETWIEKGNGTTTADGEPYYMLKAKAYMTNLTQELKRKFQFPAHQKKQPVQFAARIKGSADANTFRAKNIRAKPPAQFCQISAMRMSSAL